MANQQNMGGSQGSEQGRQQQGGQQGGQQQGQQNMGGQQGQQGSQSQYWRQQFQNEPYYQQGRQFEDYEQAYMTGEQGRNQMGSSTQRFEEAENDLRRNYEQNTQGRQNAVKWDQGGSQACRAAWERSGSQQQAGDRDTQSQQSRGQGGQQSMGQGGQQGGSGSQRNS